MANVQISEETGAKILNTIDRVLGKGPVLAYGDADGTTGHVSPQRIWIGRTDGDLDKGSTGTVKIYGNPGDTQGSETVMQVNGVDASEEVYNRFGDIEDDKWVLVIPVGEGYEVFAAEC